MPRSSFCISSGAAKRPSLSPASSTKLPPGMYALPPRSTAHTRKAALYLRLRSERLAPSSGEEGLTLSSAISKRRRGKVSDLTAEGNLSMLNMA